MKSPPVTANIHGDAFQLIPRSIPTTPPINAVNDDSKFKKSACLIDNPDAIRIAKSPRIEICNVNEEFHNFLRFTN